MPEFKLPPVSPLAGTTLVNYLRVLKGNPIHPRHWLKTILTLIIILIATPFHWYERLRFKGQVKRFKFKEEPLFILGHWRSGTTYLHNVLCEDPKAGFMTTYHALWPHNLFSKAIFRTFMSIAMPKKRPSDNVELRVDFPQEDEFCIGNVVPHFHYLFWYFPNKWREHYDQYVRFNNVPIQLKEKWNEAYYAMIVKSLIDTKGERAVFKNPSNTARIKTLLEIFPEARFIHIHRNPIVVYLSTKKFFLELYPTLTFQPVSEAEITEMVFENYENVMREFLEQRSLIPSENFIEICFEDFEKAPMDYLANLYDRLKLPGFETAKPYFQAYVDSMNTYKKNKYYTIKKWELDRILKDWEFTMKEWGYEVPQNLIIEDN